MKNDLNKFKKQLEEMSKEVDEVGLFTRVSKEMRIALSVEAAKQDKSLRRLLNEILSSYLKTLPKNR